MKNGLNRLIGIILGIVFVIPCCLFLYFSFISFPSTETIAKHYLDAIINEDIETAIKLGRSNEDCQDSLRESVLRDSDQFGGAEVRNVAIEVRGNMGSDDELQCAEVKFEYRKRNQTEWQYGEMILVTDHEVPGFRYLCGNALSGR